MAVFLYSSSKVKFVYHFPNLQLLTNFSEARSQFAVLSVQLDIIINHFNVKKHVTVQVYVNEISFERQHYFVQTMPT